MCRAIRFRCQTPSLALGPLVGFIVDQTELEFLLATWRRGRRRRLSFSGLAVYKFIRFSFSRFHSFLFSVFFRRRDRAYAGPCPDGRREC